MIAEIVINALFIEVVTALLFFSAGVIWLMSARKGMSRLIGDRRLVIITLCFVLTSTYFLGVLEHLIPAYADSLSMFRHVIDMTIMILVAVFIYEEYKESTVKVKQ